MPRKRLIPLAAVERLARKAGAERISKDAIEALSDLLGEFAEDVAVRSVKYAKYANRNTIKRDDIELSASE